MIETLRYAVGTLYMGGWSDKRGGVRDHIGVVEHFYGDRMAFVRTLCGRKGKIVYNRIRDTQEVDDWVNDVMIDMKQHRLCLTCQRSWRSVSE